MSWFEKLLPARIRTETPKKKGVPEGLWQQCKDCEATLYRAELERNLNVCPKCQCHMYISARHRLIHFLDTDGQREIATEVLPVDRLKFRDSKKYKDRLTAAQKLTKENDALVVLAGQLKHQPIVACAFEYHFIGGSMGAVVGEKFVQAVDASTEQGWPLVCFSTSGGARMQEGLHSLLQMSKTSAALARFNEKKLPFISVLVDPTMGGVSASLAMLGDIIIAEPNARIGFAGARVIEQTIREKLPEGFQRSEFLLEHGAIDMIVNRMELRNKIADLIAKITHR